MSLRIFGRINIFGDSDWQNILRTEFKAWKMTGRCPDCNLTYMLGTMSHHRRIEECPTCRRVLMVGGRARCEGCEQARPDWAKERQQKNKRIEKIIDRINKENGVAPMGAVPKNADGKKIEKLREELDREMVKYTGVI